MTITGGTLTRVLILVAGVLAIVLPNVGSFNLPISVQAVITSVGGVILAVLVYLEHPTTTTAAKTSTVNVVTPPAPKGP